MMCHIGLFVNTSGREKKQTGFSERPVLLPPVHVSIQRSRCFLLWAVLSIFSALFLLSAFSLNSTAARPPLILVELVTVTYTSSPLSAPPDAPPRSLCRVLPDGGLLCTVQSSAYESLTSMHRAMPLVHVGRAAASVALDASVWKSTANILTAAAAGRGLGKKEAGWRHTSCVDGFMLLRWMCWKNQYLHRLVGLPAHCCSSSSWGMLGQTLALRLRSSPPWTQLPAPTGQPHRSACKRKQRESKLEASAPQKLVCSSQHVHRTRQTCAVAVARSRSHCVCGSLPGVAWHDFQQEIQALPGRFNRLSSDKLKDVAVEASTSKDKKNKKNTSVLQTSSLFSQWE